MDELTRLVWDGQEWSAAPGTRRLAADGSLQEIGA